MKKKLMQSYDDFSQIPRKCAKSSSTCVDKRFNNGQDKGLISFSVQRGVTISFFAYS